MVNASLVAMEINSLLPPEEIPAKTEGYQGFFHLTDMKGNCEKAELKYIVRDHDAGSFRARQELLGQIEKRMQEKYGVQVYLEPGEAWALNAGYLVTTVLDTLQNGDTSLAVLDMSAACHTPDVIEMPYRPPLLDAGEPGEKPCTFRLGGPTCLAEIIRMQFSLSR